MHPCRHELSPKAHELSVSAHELQSPTTRYLANGTVDYLTEEGISGGGSGVVLTPRRSEANVVTFTLGVSFGR